MATNETNVNASAGHKLGQLVGDWFEECFVLPLLTDVADGLRLYLDHRFRIRPARGEKILWTDEEGNSVDYDFVMELEGSDDAIGVPVAFFECFWRRGSRHSKDKARDDSGKLAPMSQVHPTARFLGIIAAGDFTQPARQLVLSRRIDLLYVPKDKVVAAFSALGMQMEYPDRAPEEEKQRLAREFGDRLTTRHDARPPTNCGHYWENPRSIRIWIEFGPLWGRFPRKSDSSLAMILHRGYLKPSPTQRRSCKVRILTSAIQRRPTCTKSLTPTARNFERQVDSLDDLRRLHEQTDKLASHMASL